MNRRIARIVAVVWMPAALCLVSTAAAQTRVSRTSLGRAGQEYAGVWRDERGELRRILLFNDGTLQLTWLDGATASGAEPRRGDRIERFSYAGPAGRFSKRDENAYEGLALFRERDPEKCAAYSWWAPASLAFSGLHGHVVLNARKIDHAECRLTQTPDRLEISLERLVGVRFVRLESGGYIHSTYTADRRVFKSVARIAWDYTEMRPSRIRLSGSADGAAAVHIGEFTATGSYDLVSEAPGAITLILEVLDARGRVIHRDRAVADIPRM